MLRQWSTRISRLLFGMLVARTKFDHCGDTTSQTHRWMFCSLAITSPPCKTVPFSFCSERDERLKNLCLQLLNSRLCMYKLHDLHITCCALSYKMLCTAIFISQQIVQIPVFLLITKTTEFHSTKNWAGKLRVVQYVLSPICHVPWNSDSNSPPKNNGPPKSNGPLKKSLKRKSLLSSAM